MKHQTVLIYLKLVLAACVNVVLYVVWDWGLEEAPPFLVMLLFQIAWNVIAGMDIIRMFKVMDS